MTTDKTPSAVWAEQESAKEMQGFHKTLATAKHGGCVQLGDGLLPCPFCGNGAEFVPYKNNGLTLKCKSMGCIQRHQRTLRYGIEWLRTSMTEHWNGRALSAQPSPGGQGDALVTDAMVEAAHSAYWTHPDDSGEDRPCMRAALEAALAVRQPVGKIVAWRHRAENYSHMVISDQTKRALKNGEDLAQIEAINAAYCIPLYEAPPEQAEPNGKLVAWWNGITPGYDGQGVPSIRWGADAENSGHDIPLYDGFNPIHYQQPAQAVDLAAAIKAAFPLLTDYGLHHSQCCAYKLIDERHRLHNFIDSQAVGK